MIRNFSIIAHIDHGKSTLADRFLELTGTIPQRQMREQVLDRMDLERERGITIKAKAVRMRYRSADSREYVLNLIDTPGHVDFSYEVSRALAACEGAVLVVDASQGVEAQTMAHAALAERLGLKLVPVVNKVDLASADVQGVKDQIREVLKIQDEVIEASAKEGLGVEEILESVVGKIPAPVGNAEAPLSALIFDSLYDPYRGVILLVRVFEGRLRKGLAVRLISAGIPAVVEEIGYLVPSFNKADKLQAGEVGYIACGLKEAHGIIVGDTLVEEGKAARPVERHKPAKPVVFAGFFPISPGDYPNLKAALEKLHLSDSSFVYQADSSKALGFGFRLGCLGLLHMEIIRDRLEREFNLGVIATSPNVAYRVKAKGSSADSAEDCVEVNNPVNFPEHGDIVDVQEPYVNARIVVPMRYLESVVNLLKDRRGRHISIEYLSNQKIILQYELPLSEMVVDFYDKLKSVSKGFASFDYESSGYRPGDIVKLDILIHKEVVDALSLIVVREKAHFQGKAICEKLKELIPRQQFEVAVQASLNGRIIARETIPAIRKDVTAKCYGGDVTRKRKLLEKQKAGKSRLKLLGSVSIPQEAFLAVLKIGR